jgi:GT2 family glycosyltransferase
MQLSIIILTFNTKDQTAICIDAVIKHYRKLVEEKEFEIIVFDNGSTDGTREEIHSSPFRGKNITYVYSNENLGFSKGINAASERAKGDYLLFLNSDAIFEDNSLVEVLDYLTQHLETGVVGLQMLGKNGRIEQSAGSDYTLSTVFSTLFGLKQHEKLPQTIHRVDWVSGGSLIIRRSLFERLKGFDEKLFMYMEDVDLCFRVRKIGLNVVYYPSVSVIHKGQGSSNRTFAIVNIYKGLLYFYKKHKSFPEFFLVKLMLFIKAFVALIIGIVTGNKYLKTTYSQAIGLLV